MLRSTFFIGISLSWGIFMVSVLCIIASIGGSAIESFPLDTKKYVCSHPFPLTDILPRGSSLCCLAFFISDLCKYFSI